MALDTLKQHTDKVLIAIDDPQVPVDWIHGWLNEAMADLAEVLKLEGKATIPIVAGTDEYALPADLFTLRLVKFESETLARGPVPLSDFTATGYKLWNGKLILQRTPTTADVATIWYHRMPAAMTDEDDTPEIPEAFQHVIRAYACAAYQAQQNATPIEASTFWQTYQVGKAAIERTSAKRGAMQAPYQWTVQRR